MIKTVRAALKVEEIRTRLLFTFWVLVVVRIGCSIPVTGMNSTLISQFFTDKIGDSFNFFNTLTGGSFSRMSIFALSISPYITSSIVVQLLTIAIPALDEMHKDGEDGRKKLEKLTRYLTIVLAVIESAAMAIGFGASGYLTDYTWYNVVIIVIIMTAGSTGLMWLGEEITDKGMGNGISMILLFNILSSLPTDLKSVYSTFMDGKNIGIQIVAVIVTAIVIILMTIFVILLQDGERRVPVQYAKKMQGRKQIGGQASNIPIKVNTAGVIPVIFASSLFSLPVVIASFFDIDYTTIGGKIIKCLNTSNWINPSEGWIYSIGLIVYCVLLVLFAYFYTSITFNPVEISENMKKQGGFIPGIRPGKFTADYLTKILNYLVFIGAIGLMIVALIPIVLSGVFGLGSLSFTGTSLIIIVGVVLETLKKIEAMMKVRHYSGFIND